MKKILFIVILLLLFGILYWLNLNSDPKFTWTPTYSTDDKQPYGCYVLDELLSASWEEGYTHSYESIFALSDSTNDSIPEDHALLIICNYFRLSEYSLPRFFEYIEKGGTVFIAAEDFYSGLTDSLSIGYNYDIHASLGLPFLDEKEAVYFSNTSLGDSIQVPRSMLIKSFEIGTQRDKALSYNVHSLAVKGEDESVLLHYRFGEGNLYLCYSPLLFTNYAVLDPLSNPFIRQALAPLQGKPLVRTEYYESLGQSRFVQQKQESVFKYLLSQPALKWAYYLVWVLVILFMVFTAKRKQKPIPVVTPPDNKMLGFVRSITTLYLRRNNNADILRKKNIYWSDQIRRLYGIDIVNEPHDRAFVKRFSAKTGMPEADARQLFLILDGIGEDTYMSDEEMMKLIMKMKIN